MVNEEPSEYINVRIPKKEYEKLKETKKMMSDTPDYSWVKNLALGALIGLVAGIVMKEISKK